jgi:hypothetical protein
MLVGLITSVFIAVELNVTCVSDWRLVPVNVTVIGTESVVEVGVKDVIVGRLVTVMFWVDVAEAESTWTITWEICTCTVLGIVQVTLVGEGVPQVRVLDPRVVENDDDGERPEPVMVTVDCMPVNA